jgi:hypothetical protein
VGPVASWQNKLLIELGAFPAWFGPGSPSLLLATHCRHYLRHICIVYLFIYGLFKDAVSSSAFTATDDKIINE